MTGTAALLWVVAQALPSGAPPSDAWLRWSEPQDAPRCSERDAFVGQVAERLGRSPQEAAASLGVTIEARVEHLDVPRPHWAGDVRVVRPDGTVDGQRTVERFEAGCQPLLDTMALVTALVLRSGPEPASPPTPAPPLPARVDLEIPGLPARQPPPIRPWTVTVGAGAGVGAGLLPGRYATTEALVLVRHKPLGGLAALVWSPAFDVSAGSGRSVTFSRLGVELDGCAPRLLTGSRALDLCAGAQLGRLQASGAGFDLSTPQGRWSVAAAARGDFRQRLFGPLFVSADAQLMVPLERDRISYFDAQGRLQPIFRTAPVAGAAHVQVGLWFR